MSILIIRLRGVDQGGGPDAVAEESGALARALESLGDEYPYLSCIDSYGLTTFNRLQAKRLLMELERARSEPSFTHLQDIIDRVAGLAQRCAGEVDVYLEFEGD